MRKLLQLCLAGVLLGSLWGCATSPYASGNKARSDALLAAQIAQAQSRIAQGPAPRLLFAGLAMDDRSEAFRHDVLLAEKIAGLVDPQAVVFKLVNPALGQAADLPYATRENIEAVLQQIGALARPQDKVMLLLSTHGGPGLLSVHAGNAPLGMVTTADLVKWLAPLRERATWLVVSACYSGSFIPPLQQPKGIIFTAAAKDRASFGCGSKSDNTYFVKELFGQPTLAAQNLRELMAHASQGVAQRERNMKLAPPSLPQYYFGGQAQAWALQPIGDWLRSAPPATTDAANGQAGAPLK